MKDFKLIAIRPLNDCDTKFTKILTKDFVYSFYNYYDFSTYTDKNRKLKVKPNYDTDFYSIKNNYGDNVKINISAIVGENGSGKSSLVELFYLASFNLSAISGVLFDEEDNRFLSLDDIVNDVHVELFYKIDKNIHLLKISGNKVEHFKLLNDLFLLEKEKFSLNNFFYSIALNYSLHSLNSEVLGDWVKKIFHKNDGYQTPIVLNPYRDKGNIEINNEEYLVKNRLISNVLGKTNKRIKSGNSLKNIIDDKIAYRLLVKLNKDKFTFEDEERKIPIFDCTNKIGDRVLPLVYKYFLKNEKFTPRDTKLNRYAKEYILKKLVSIASKYDPYKRMFRFFSDDIDKSDTYIKMLSKDKSHVTFKLIQTINFLDNELYFRRKESFDLTVSYLSKQLDTESKLKSKELIDILPPAFFNIDIEFKDSDLFNQLSSGEKQRVYSLSTLLYHINNLNSTDSTIVNHKYNNLNIIFDEIELYFHPELQRVFINDILESLKKVELNDIYSINFLLITHSPFILSDIIDTNILFLAKKTNDLKTEKIKTFGGNIHEILSNSFFLENGLIGEFARNKIQRIINRLNSKNSVSKEGILNEIETIGEPFLKEKLIEMYYNKFDKQFRIKQLKSEIEKLENND